MSSGAKYSTGSTRYQTPIPMTKHALERYRERLPGDAVEPAAAWERGEDIQHPAVVQSLDNSRPPSRVRVYNHDQQYLAVFVIDDRGGEAVVVTCYSSETHNHGPTRAYLNSHGPHWREDGDGR